VLWGGDSLKVSSPGNILTYKEGKSPGKGKRLFTIEADSYGQFDLEAATDKGIVWCRLRVAIASATDAQLRREVLQLLRHKVVAKMKFQVGKIKVTPQRLRKVRRLIESGEIVVRYMPSGDDHHGGTAAYNHTYDVIKCPVSSLEKLGKKAQMMHELVHAAVDAHQPGKHKITDDEGAGNLAYAVFVRYVNPQKDLSQLYPPGDPREPLLRVTWNLAGKVLNGQTLTQTEQYRLKKAVRANPTYKKKIEEQNNITVFDGV
jgi:hypothetical protein